jgi:multiple RNA-binding domain-containing protein 1
VQDTLRAVFEKVGHVRAVTVARKAVGAQKMSLGASHACCAARRADTLTAGFGFVEFAARPSAMEALKKLQGVTVDEHALELKISTKKVAPAAAAAAAAAATASDAEQSFKLIVKNLPFQANKKELKQLFRCVVSVSLSRSLLLTAAAARVAS